MSKVLALIGDIIDSKIIKERIQFQEKLKNSLEKINKISKQSILSPYIITLGDEFQVVYTNPNSLFYDYWKIIQCIYPQKVRFSLGLQNLSTKINFNAAIGMDGPAFHEARKGLLELKNMNKMNVILISPNEKKLRFFNESLSIFNLITSKWRLNSIKIMNHLLEDLSINEIAEKINISVNGVYKNIEKQHIKSIIKFQNIFIEDINKLW